MNAIRTSIAGAILAAGALLIAPVNDSFAQTPPSGSPPAHPGARGHHGHGPGRLYEKLGLTPEQKTTIDGIVAAKGPALKTLREQLRANMRKLHQTTPDDPNYATVVSQAGQSSGSLTAQMITAGADLRAQMYAVLTPAQKTQLAALQAQMQARMKNGGARGWGHRPPPAEGATSN